MKRHLKFSLRTLFLFVTLVAAYFGGWRHGLRQPIVADHSLVLFKDLKPGDFFFIRGARKQDANLYVKIVPTKFIGFTFEAERVSLDGTPLRLRSSSYKQHELPVNWRDSEYMIEIQRNAAVEYVLNPIERFLDSDASGALAEVAEGGE